MKWLKSLDKFVLLIVCALIVLVLGIGVLNERSRFLKPKESLITEKIQNYINQKVEQKKFSGCILIESKGQIVVNKAYGMANYELDVPNTTKTKFSLGSLTKTFTATAVMQMVEKQKIGLQDTIDKYIPEYPNGDKITISQLLSHTSGIPDLTEFSDFMDKARLYRTPEQLIDSFKNKPLDFEPGSKFKYSNSGYVLLGYIIEKVTNQTYEQYLTENIFEPLDMNDTGQVDSKKIIKDRALGYSVVNRQIDNCDMSDISYAFGGGNLYSTVEDLDKWNQGMYSPKIMSKQSWDQMLKARSDYYGYGWMMYDEVFDNGNIKKKVAGHGGTVFGFNSIFKRYIDDDTVIIVLSNFENYKEGSIAGNIAYDLEAINLGVYRP